jgi:Type II restriction endonuclease, TdeIII
MISELQKELIAIQVIRTLYSQFDKFPEDVGRNRNAPFHEAFLNAFANKLEGKVSSIPVFISLSSWMHGLNTSLGQSFFENVGQILCYGTKKEFTARAKTLLQLNSSQKLKIANVITGLSNGDFNPDSLLDDEEIVEILEELENSTGFTADIFFEDEDQVVCIELKTVKPNKGIFKVEKQKILEAKAALRTVYPNKSIKFFIGFPFDPLSKEPTGFDKQRFMNYSVDFRKYFGESEFLLSAELWDYLSSTTGTMETILEIINSIATVEFVEKFDFLQNKDNSKNRKDEYIALLQKWYLFRELNLTENQEVVYSKIFTNKKLVRIFNEDVFRIERKEDDYKVKYNEKRVFALTDFL